MLGIEGQSNLLMQYREMLKKEHILEVTYYVTRRLSVGRMAWQKGAES